MKITVLTTEKIRSSFTKDAIMEYAKRLNTFTKIEYKVTKNLLKEIPQRAYIIQIATLGENISSEDLAKKIEYITTHGTSHIVILLGVTSKEINPDTSIAISPMDIGMDILPIILYEQIYRAFTIIQGCPYHK